VTRLGTFAALYMTAFVLDLAERWRYPAATVWSLALLLVVLGVGITRVTLLGFLAAATGYVLLARFPDVANHVNIALLCNLILMAGLGWSLRRRAEYAGDDDAFEMVRPALQVSLVLVYVLAGFAKLNTDFLNPAVSCAGTMVGSLTRAARSEVAGVPVGAILGAALLATASRLLAARGLGRPLLMAAGLVLAVGIAASGGSPGSPPSPPAWMVLATAALVIAWELGLGPLLAVPALQWPVLAFSWVMHASLALIGFVDFGALALALFYPFVPRGYAELLAGQVRLPYRGLQLPRPCLYVAISLLAGVFSALGRRLLAGLCFNLAVLVLFWPMLTALASPARPAWRGVPLFTRRTPPWLYGFPLLLLLHGLTSYLGLRTAGNFTMFSNLRTEGERSNHLLLSGNPLKRWRYQEDEVRVIRIDDRRAEIGYQYQPLQGHRLPVVEFRKLIEQWTRAGTAVPMSFVYAGTLYRTDDITQDPTWRAAGWSWEMRLMDFRVIQAEGPNQCRW
jgi:hypothetical protein